LKIIRLGPNEIFHRYVTPKWAFLPLSGAGAALGGGRFNRPGAEALYLSRAPQTALEEYRQGASIAPPATLAAYKITLTEAADLSAGFDPAIWPTQWSDWRCNWRKLSRVEKKIPPSWSISDQLITAGFRGLLFPSLRHAGGTNLVIFSANLTAADVVEVHDPEGFLPRDQSSWPPYP
jgi:RES domain-containing protein